VGDILDSLAVDLNDAGPVSKHSSWSRDSLRDWLLEGLRVLLKADPGPFERDAVLELRPCLERQPVCPCASLSWDGVLGQSDERGRVIKRLRRRQEAPGLRWDGPSCPPDPSRPFRLRSYSVAPSGEALSVHPAPPPGEKVFLALRCAVLPDGSDESEMPDSAVPAARQWVLWRARMVDGESDPASYQAAMAHQAAFAGLAGHGRLAPRRAGSAR
jgi:hypothetical protein